MADYRDHYAEMRSAGASVAAVSVDAAEKSEALRAHLSLPFPILCDTEHRVVRDWGVYNSQEKGGIAKPAVFIIDPDRLVRYASVDKVVMRVPAVEVVAMLQNVATTHPVRRRAHIPLLSGLIRAIRNYIHR